MSTAIFQLDTVRYQRHWRKFQIVFTTMTLIGTLALWFGIGIIDNTNLLGYGVRSGITLIFFATLAPFLLLTRYRAKQLLGATLQVDPTTLTQITSKQTTSIKFGDLHAVSKYRKNGLVSAATFYAGRRQIGLGFYENVPQIWEMIEPRLPDSAEIYDRSGLIKGILASPIPPYLIVFPMMAIAWWFGYGWLDTFNLAMPVGFGTWFLLGGVSYVFRPIFRRGRLARRIVELALGVLCLMLIGTAVNIRPTVFTPSNPCNLWRRHAIGCTGFVREASNNFSIGETADRLIYLTRSDRPTIREVANFGRVRKTTVSLLEAPSSFDTPSFSADGNHLLTVDYDEITFIDLAQENAVWLAQLTWIIDSSISADGSTVAASHLPSFNGDRGFVAAIFNTIDGELLHEAPQSLLTALSPQGTQLVHASSGDVVRLTDLNTKTAQVILPDDQVDAINALAFSPDGSQIAVISNKEAILFSAETGNHLSTIIFPSDWRAISKFEATLSPDNQLLFLAFKVEAGATTTLGTVAQPLDADHQAVYLATINLGEQKVTQTHLLVADSFVSVEGLAVSGNGETVGVSTRDGLYLFDTARLGALSSSR